MKDKGGRERVMVKGKRREGEAEWKKRACLSRGERGGRGEEPGRQREA